MSVAKHLKLLTEAGNWLRLAQITSSTVIRRFAWQKYERCMDKARISMLEQIERSDEREEDEL